MFIEKPGLALLVTTSDVSVDGVGFELDLDIDEILVAPSDFDPKARLRVGCDWNQPYLSFSPDSICAAYAFRMHFDSEGFRRSRELSAEMKSRPGGVSVLASQAQVFSGCFEQKDEL